MAVKDEKKPEETSSKTFEPSGNMKKDEKTLSKNKLKKGDKNKRLKFARSCLTLTVLYIFLGMKPGQKFTTFVMVSLRDFFCSACCSLYWMLHEPSYSVHQKVHLQQEFNTSASMGTCSANPFINYIDANESVAWCSRKEKLILPDFRTMFFLLCQVFKQINIDSNVMLWHLSNLFLKILKYGIVHAIGTFISVMSFLIIFGCLIKLLPTLMNGLSCEKFSSNLEDIFNDTEAGSRISADGKKAKSNRQGGSRSSLLSMFLTRIGKLTDGFVGSKQTNSSTNLVSNEETGISIVTLADYKGGNEAKKELELVLDFLRNPQRFHDMGARLPRGILLYGPPGTGKTLFARALAGEANVDFLHKCASEFRSMFVGSGAKNIRAVFAAARKSAPCILFIDEIDSISKRTTSSNHPYANQAINQILHEMDGFARDESNVVVIGATNRLDNMDEALLRPGRFDKHIHVDLPDFDGRKEILEHYVGRLKKVGDDVDFSTIATKTDEYSGAELENLVNEAAIIAVAKGAEKVEQKHLEEAVKKLLGSREKMQKYDSGNYKPSRRKAIEHMYN